MCGNLFQDIAYLKDHIINSHHLYSIQEFGKVVNCTHNSSFFCWKQANTCTFHFGWTFVFTRTYQSQHGWIAYYLSILHIELKVTSLAASDKSDQMISMSLPLLTQSDIHISTKSNFWQKLNSQSTHLIIFKRSKILRLWWGLILGTYLHNDHHGPDMIMGGPAQVTPATGT